MDRKHEKMPSGLKKTIKKSISAFNPDRSKESKEDFGENKDFTREERGSEDVYDMYKNGSL